MGLQGIADWILAQVEILLLIVFVILLIVTAYKRAWIAMAAVIVGFAFIGIFVVNPNILLTLSEWLNGRLQLGQ